jgi:hypothetical protein
MEIRVCPECNKAYYTAAVEYRPPCPHCGHVLLDRRTQERTITAKDLSFFIEGTERSATLIDLSKDGGKIIYDGESFPANTTLDINIDELNIHRTARAVWTKELTGSKVTAGLKFL